MAATDIYLNSFLFYFFSLFFWGIEAFGHKILGLQPENA
jgi:hypothetical protein